MTDANGRIESALDDLKAGKFILVYDSDKRERETDLIIASQFVTPESIQTLRLDGGGIIFLMASYEIHNKLGLPYLSDVFYKAGSRWPLLKDLIPNDIPYDTKSSFSVTINHRKTFTGVTDKDRALTISEFARTASEVKEMDTHLAQKLFGSRFRSPGHVAICNASQKPLENRFGHSELGIALVKMAGLLPTATGCEMMDCPNALTKEEAAEYAREKDLTFLEGVEIIDAWKNWNESK